MADNCETSIVVERRGDSVAVRIHGRVTEREASRIEQDLLALVAEGAVKIAIDVSDVPLITSAGLGALMVVHKESKAGGGRVRLVGAQPLVRQILETTKLTKLFGLFDSVSEALAAD